MLQNHREVLFSQLAFEGFTRRQQIVPGFRVGYACLFPGLIVEVEHASGNGDWDPVQLAVHGGGLQLFGIELA